MNLFVEKTAINLVAGAMGSLLPKLAELLKDEYKLKKSVKESISSLEKEMKGIHAALHKVADVPRDQLDEQVKLWAGEVRELSFDMEDVVDKFLVRVDDGSEATTNSNKLKRLTEKMAGLFTKGKARHEIADAIKDINKKVQEVANRRGRYTVDSIVARPPSVMTIDPRIGALYKEVAELEGIAGKRDRELMRLLLEGDKVSEKKLKIVSVVGFGGLGKTTLVKAVYDEIKRDFICRAFVPVGQNANVKKILIDILLDLEVYESHFAMLDERQLINKLRQLLENKRYLIVIDDIWDENLWTIINLAFSRSNNFGSRIITTTRIVSVSKLCCSSTDDSVYQMEPLSDNDSRRLFYKRIFSDGSGCPPELKKVSMDILKKCGGVPLAIVSIAGLLASDHHVKPEYEWHVLLEAIGRGLTEDRSVEQMLRILSFSYYDLPSHMKTCLLYLSMFPEDYTIRKERLIWMWIAESFVQRGKTKSSIYEIGETYFNELVNRSLIQPVYNYGVLREVKACRVHDMVLDLICSLSREENFVTIWNGIGDGMSSKRNIRRLSVRVSEREEDKTTPLEFVDMFQVRSAALFGPDVALILSFSSFSVLRVLDLNGFHKVGDNKVNLRELGSLLHLRYLGLSETNTSKVPEEFGKLQFLEVLDLSGNRWIGLPSTVIKLKRLMCLLIDSNHNRLPDGLVNLTSMEVLSKIYCDSLTIVKGLGNMNKLRELSIVFDHMRLEMEDAFVESLGKLSNIQSLKVNCFTKDEPADILGECWVAPPSIQEFVAAREFTFSALPAWIRRDPSLLPQLLKLELFLEEVRQEDLDILGMLSALRSLRLGSRRQRRLVLIGAEGFRCVTSFNLFSCSRGQVIVQPGALHKTEEFGLRIGLLSAKDEAPGYGGHYFDIGVGSLPSLREVQVWFGRRGATVGEAKRAAAALVEALRAHPNCPSSYVSIDPPIPDGARDEDVCIESE